jgi:hypothetical protein
MTTTDEIKYAAMTRIAGQSEEAALDVLSEGGKYRAFVSALERGDAIVGNTVSVSTSAIALRAGGANATNRRAISVQNKGTNPIYVGPSTVTAANGFEVAVGASVSFPLSESATLYGIAPSGTQDIRVVEVS